MIDQTLFSRSNRTRLDFNHFKASSLQTFHRGTKLHSLSQENQLSKQQPSRSNQKRSSNFVDLVPEFQKKSDSRESERRWLKKAIKLSLESESDDPNLVGWRSESNSPVGLRNVKNSCYFNTIIQTFLKIESFVKIINAYNTVEDLDGTLEKLRVTDPIEIKRKKRSVDLVIELQILFTNLQNGNLNSLNPSRAINCILDNEGNQLKRGEELDIQEFLLNLLERLEEGLSLGRRALYTYGIDSTHQKRTQAFHELFYGESEEFTIFPNGRYRSPTRGSFGSLSMNMQEKNLGRGLDAYLKDSVEITENGRTIQGSKTTKIIKPPQVLVFILHRVRVDRDTGIIKLNDIFEFPKEIDIGKHLKTKANQIKCGYVLSSIIIHEGDATSGHYYALIYDLKENKWQKFNDSIVSDVTEEEVFRLAKGRKDVLSSGDQKKSSCAYCLFYIRKTSDSIPIQDIENLVLNKEIPGGFETSASLTELTDSNQTDDDIVQLITRGANEYKRLLKASHYNNTNLRKEQADFVEILKKLKFIFEHVEKRNWKEALRYISSMNRIAIKVSRSYNFILFLQKLVSTMYLEVTKVTQSLWVNRCQDQALELIEMLVYCLIKKESIDLTAVCYLQISTMLQSLLDYRGSNMKDEKQINRLRENIGNLQTKTMTQKPVDMSINEELREGASKFENLEVQIVLYCEALNRLHKAWIKQSENFIALEKEVRTKKDIVQTEDLSCLIFAKQSNSQKTNMWILKLFRLWLCFFSLLSRLLCVCFKINSN